MDREVMNKYKKAAEEEVLSNTLMGRMSNEEVDPFLKWTKPIPTVSVQKTELAYFQTMCPILPTTAI